MLSLPKKMSVKALDKAPLSSSRRMAYFIVQFHIILPTPVSISTTHNVNTKMIEELAVRCINYQDLRRCSDDSSAEANLVY